MKWSSRPRSSGVRRLAVIVTAAVLGVSAVTASVAVDHTQAIAQQQVATARTAKSAADAAQLTVTVSPDNGGILAPGQDLTVQVAVTNDTATPFVAGTIDLWMDKTPIDSRKSLATWLGSTDAVPGAQTIGRAPLGGLEPGSTSVVRVTVPAASVPITARTTQGVFGIGTTVSIGSATKVSGRSTISWNAGAEITRSNVTVVMPITAPATAAGLIPAADLAAFTAPNGVLTRQVDGLIGHPSVAIGIDPMILASIRVLGTAAPASATQWMLSLSQLPNDVFSLGYGDADLSGQFQSGLNAPLAPTALGYAMDPANFQTEPAPVGEPTGTATTEPGDATPTPTPTPTTPTGPVLPTLDQLTAWPYSLHGIAWPAENAVRSSDLGSLVANGFHTPILSGDNTNAADLATTPDSVLPISGGKALVADSGISTALRAAATATDDTGWNAAMSQVNAQLGLVSEDGGGQRSLTVTLGRSWPSSGTQLERTLRAIQTSPWTNAVSLPRVLASAPTPGLTFTSRSESQARLTGIKGLLDTETRINDFATILDDPATMTGQNRAQLLTLLAVSWTEPRNDWSNAVSNNLQSSFKILNSVRILPTENVNLVSAQGSIPFSVNNGLPNEAVTVVLSASPSNSRLEIDEDATKRIQPNSRATVLVPVKAKLGNGQVILTLQLLSPTGVKIGTPTAVTVDVHADWEGIGALIVGILLVLLFGFGIVRNILRRRRENSAAGREGDAGATESAPDGNSPDGAARTGDPLAGDATAGAEQHSDDTKEPSV
ncbi:hypothetical protein G3T36_05145 [Diaminobutyricibacter tongyongensis]|uniref:2-oxoglutarate dehydrogenase n=1 Tax=Leifsonia tongyongensis TaxID=1268043 RepID=A0A6L9XV54_9MICO|nr:DUF6049 family protein [Diaminobutyricibacter tongyongensis]NEN05253.1 hypothetical protein [Diaminobutyricibacter tongyongensis]